MSFRYRNHESAHYARTAATGHNQRALLRTHTPARGRPPPPSLSLSSGTVSELSSTEEEEEEEVSPMFSRRTQHSMVQDKHIAETTLRNVITIESPNNQAIALTMMLRGWRLMAEAKRQRREELVDMWALAVRVHRDNMLHRVAVGVKRAAHKVISGPGHRFQRLYYDLADRYCRKILLSRTMQRLTYASEVLNRFTYWQHEHNRRLVAGCLSVLRQEMGHRREIALQEAQRRDRQGLLLRRWHMAMMEERRKSEQKALASRALCGWHRVSMLESECERTADKFGERQLKHRTLDGLRSIRRQQKDSRAASVGRQRTNQHRPSGRHLSLSASRGTAGSVDGSRGAQTAGRSPRGIDAVTQTSMLERPGLVARRDVAVEAKDDDMSQGALDLQYQDGTDIVRSGDPDDLGDLDAAELERARQSITRRHKRRVLNRWRTQALRDVEDMRMADMHYARTKRQQFVERLFNQFYKVKEMDQQADTFRRTLVISDFWGAIMGGYCKLQIEREDAAELNHSMLVEAADPLAAQNADLVEENQELEPLGYEDIEAEAGLEPIIEDADNERIAQIFDAWHKLVRDRQALEDRVYAGLPNIMQERAFYESDGYLVFDWGVVHRHNLLRRCLHEFCRIAVDQNIQKATPYMASGMLEDSANTHVSIIELTEDFDSDGSDLDGQNGDTLRQLEARISSTHEQNMVADSIRKWIVATRGSLLSKGRLVKSMRPVFASIARCARIAKVARDKEREALLNPAIHRWRNRLYAHRLAMDNSAVQSDAVLVQTCFRRLVDKHRRHADRDPAGLAEKRSKDMYMQALAFRWESQTRMAVGRWMRASSDDRVKISVAQRDETMRESRIERVAEGWSRKRTARNVFRRLRAVARNRRLQHDLEMRFADAWCNANLRRQVLLAWRAKTSPNSSAFFSVSEPIAGY